MKMVAWGGELNVGCLIEARMHLSLAWYLKKALHAARELGVSNIVGEHKRRVKCRKPNIIAHMMVQNIVELEGIHVK